MIQINMTVFVPLPREKVFFGYCEDEELPKAFIDIVSTIKINESTTETTYRVKGKLIKVESREIEKVPNCRVVTDSIFMSQRCVYNLDFSSHLNGTLVQIEAKIYYKSTFRKVFEPFNVRAVKDSELRKYIKLNRLLTGHDTGKITNVRTRSWGMPSPISITLFSSIIFGLFYLLS